MLHAQKALFKLVIALSDVKVATLLCKKLVIRTLTVPFPQQNPIKTGTLLSMIRQS